MNETQTFLVYFVSCLVLTGFILWIINTLDKGLKKFFGEFFADEAIAGLFTKMVKLALVLAGVGAAIGTTFAEGASKNWLTLTWSVAEQFEQSFREVLIILAVFIGVFLLFAAIAKRSGRKVDE